MEKRKRNDPSPTKKRSKINTLDAFLGLKPKLKETPPISEKPLASTDTKIAEIFLTKEEKKKRKIEKNLEKLRAELEAKKREDILLNDGKPSHPYFSQSFQQIQWEEGGRINMSIEDLPSLPYFPNQDFYGTTAHCNDDYTNLPPKSYPSIKYKLVQEYEYKNDTLGYSLMNFEEGGSQNITEDNYQMSYSEFINTLSQHFETENINKLILYYNQRKSEGENLGMWVDMYKPNDTNNIIGNENNMQMLKSWLSDRKIIKDNGSKKKKKKKKNVEDEEEYKSTNAMLLVGPTGIGKTASVYACANELGFRIIENNSCNKRTGSSIMSLLSEVTQSQVIENSSSDNFSQDTILLFEEIDVLFEEDTGFFHSLKLLIEQSKRPIILTCNTYTSSIRDLLVNYDIYTLNYSLPEISTISLNIQALTLSYNVYILPEQIALFIQYFKCDIRSILNNLQYYLTDKLTLSSPSYNLSHPCPEQDLLQVTLTDLGNLLLSDSRSNTITSLLNCDSREFFKNKYNSAISLTEKIHTNSFYFELLKTTTTENSSIANFIKREEHLCKMDSLEELYLNMIFTHYIQQDSYEDILYFCKQEIIANIFLMNQSGKSINDLTEHICNTLKNTSNVISNNHKKMYKQLRFTILPLFITNVTIELDYLPYLRDIARYEIIRRTAQNKRRFTHYLTSKSLLNDNDVHNIIQSFPICK